MLTPVHPCGQGEELLKRGGYSYMDVFGDGRPPIEVEWFRMPEGGNVHAEPHAFRHRYYSTNPLSEDVLCFTEKNPEHAGLGIQWPYARECEDRYFVPYPIARGAPAAYSGLHRCGSDYVWSHGPRPGVDPVYQCDENGAAPCCALLGQVGQGGDADGGSAPIRCDELPADHTVTHPYLCVTLLDEFPPWDGGTLVLAGSPSDGWSFVGGNVATVHWDVHVACSTFSGLYEGHLEVIARFDGVHQCNLHDANFVLGLTGYGCSPIAVADFIGSPGLCGPGAGPVRFYACLSQTACCSQAGRGGDADNGTADQASFTSVGAGGDVDQGEASQAAGYAQSGAGGDADQGEASQAAGYAQSGAGGDADQGEASQAAGYAQSGAGGDADGGRADQYATITVDLAPGTASWIVPAGVSSAYVECWAGGGGGAACGGGGGGGYAAAVVGGLPGGVAVAVGVGTGGEANADGVHTYFGAGPDVEAHPGHAGYPESDGLGGGGMGTTVATGGAGGIDLAFTQGGGGGGGGGPIGAGGAGSPGAGGIGGLGGAGDAGAGDGDGGAGGDAGAFGSPGAFPAGGGGGSCPALAFTESGGDGLIRIHYNI